MLIRRIKGCTDTIGKEQGYNGLPIREVIKPTNIGGQVYPLLHVESAWEPTPLEMQALVNGASVVVSVLTFSHPLQPLNLYVETNEDVTADDAADIGDALGSLERAKAFYLKVCDEQTAHMIEPEDRPIDPDLYEHTMNRLGLVTHCLKLLRQEYTDDEQPSAN